MFFFLLWKGYPSAYFHSAHILRDSKALFIALFSCGWGGAASASEHVYGLSQIESAVFKRRMPFFRSIYFQII